MPNDKKKKQTIKDLNNITKFTNMRTYGVSKDMPGILTNDINEFIDKLNTDREKNKSLINSRMSKERLDRSKSIKNTNIYDIIDSPEVLGSIESTIGSENIRFAQLLKDYEMIKRCIPQVHRVVNVIKNNIISPDSMGSNNILGISIPEGTNQSDEKKIRGLVEKYELNQRIQDEIVMDYLIASVKYVTIVPYSVIPDMLYQDPNDPNNKKLISINECVERFNRLTENDVKPLYEAAGSVEQNELNSLTETVLLENSDFIQDDIKENMNYDISSYVNSQLKDIEFVNGGLAYYKNALLNEAVNILSTDDKELKAMKNIVNKVQKESGKLKNFINDSDIASEGLIDTKTYKDIKRTVDFRGAHIEYLPASRTISFKLRDTIVGYFYVEDRIDPNKTNNNTMSIMDKINASVYIKNTKVNRSKEVEEIIVRNISEKLVKAINGKFINDNYDDMDIIYEFVKANELYKKPKRVVFFHPDDICEFRRADGSIMKNCMFYAKLVILTLLSNILAKVTRGSDRNLYFVKTGLTTDIEGSVNDTIRAIKQNQIRYSDIGTINEIFNIVGSAVDVFMPVSVDGERPIETETISGQNIDMNEDFINSLIRSIIQSFGVPASMIEEFDSIDFAKTISMSNLEMAKAVYDAQIELNPDLTKMFRLLVKYELPEYEQYDDIDVKLNPPSIIVYEMNRDRMDSIDQVAEKLGELLIAPENESSDEKKRRMFKLEYYRRTMSSWDWDMIDDILNQVTVKSKELEIEESLNSDEDSDDLGNDQY